jgi:Ni/Co efflux regulator RcnB
MKRLLALLALAAFVFPFAPAASASAQDDDHGKHKGWYKHGDDDDDDGYRHDNGKHKGWYKHHDRGDYDDWDYDGERIRPGYYYPRGRYPYIRQVIVVRGFDPRTRHIILYDQSNWVVAPYDVPRCRDWEWDRDRVYVYDDDRHPGWYVLFNSRLGRSIHVELFGM